MQHRFIAYAAKHKIATVVLLLAAIAAGFYGKRLLSPNTAEVKYALATATKGTLIVSTSGSGQVSSSNQIDIKPKTSGTVTGIFVQSGAPIKAGTLLFEVDSTDARKTLRNAKISLQNAELSFAQSESGAEKAVRNAETSLANAKLAMEKLQAPTDTLTQLQALHALESANATKTQAEADLVKARENAWNAVANAFLDLPDVMASTQELLFGSTAAAGQWNIDFYKNNTEIFDHRATQYHTDAYDTYQTARTRYDAAFAKYKAADRLGNTTDITSLLDETYETAKYISESLKSTDNLIQLYKDVSLTHDRRPVAIADTHLNTIGANTDKTNATLTNLLSAKNAIISGAFANASAERTVTEKTLSLEKLSEGPDDLDVRTQELTIQERENALADAKEALNGPSLAAQALTVSERRNAVADAEEALAECAVRAPFDGIIAKINIQEHEDVSSGTAAITMLSSKKIAEISLNEMDVAQIKVGQKVTLALDAIPNLTLSGTVVEVDTLGTTSQGVVTYGVKIAFDAQDERIKPSMSVTTNIITNAKAETLLVPTSAIKTQGDITMIDVVAETAPEVQNMGSGPLTTTLKTAPERKTIEIGLANDEYTEVVSGLSEGDIIVTRTVKQSATSNTQNQSGNRQNTFMLPGVSGGMPPRR